MPSWELTDSAADVLGGLIADSLGKSKLTDNIWLRSCIARGFAVGITVDEAATSCWVRALNGSFPGGGAPGCVISTSNSSGTKIDSASESWGCSEAS